MEKTGSLHFVAGFLLSFISIPAFAGWGHLNDFNEDWADWALIHDVVQRQEVRFCLKISDPQQFPRDSQLVQIESALRLWESEVEAAGAPQIQNIEVECTDSKLDLMVRIGPDQQHPALNGYQLAVRGQPDYSMVSLNTDFRWVKNSKIYLIEDFARVVPHVEPLSNFLKLISFTQPQSTTDLGTRLGLDYEALFWTTYRLYIHEFGHAFGLCDTYDEQVENCDPGFSSATHPSSVMKDSSYFYLTEDDKLGIQALYRRFNRR